MDSTPLPEPDPDVVRQWLIKAGDDLAVAELVLSKASTARWAACFHAQQAVEKSMKALFVARMIGPFDH